MRFPTTVDVFAEVDGVCPGETPPPPRFGIYITHASVPFYPSGARERGIEVAELSLQKPSLDEVFLTITGHTAESPADFENEEAAA